jgi:hypothetical protein
MILYFAFGSNLDRDQMARRCPGCRPRFPARLDDHRLAFSHLSLRWGGGAADVIPAPGSVVWGGVYELDPGHLDQLDRYEAGYLRIALAVRDLQGGLHRVTSYSVTDKGEHRPSRHYLQKILDWAERWELPATYLMQLRAISVCD